MSTRWGRRRRRPFAAAALITAALTLAPVAVLAFMQPAAAAVTSIPLPPFNECPAVGASSGCKVLLVVNPDGTVSVYSDPSVGDYDGADDTMVGIWNQSSGQVDAVTVSGAGSGLGNLDGDGLCSFAVTGCPFGPTGYEGPGTSLVTDPNTPDAAEVDFTGGLAANSTTYFSLEGTLTDAVLTARQGHLESLHVSTQVLDWPGWVDPTQDPLVQLRIAVTNGDGSPAAGASVTLNNTHATFTTKADGTINLAEKIGLAVNPMVNVQASLGSETANASVTLFTVDELTQCHLPGVPSKLDALTPLLDFMLPEAPAGQLGKFAGHVLDWLGAVNTAKDALPDSETTVADALKYTGAFRSPIYQLNVEVDNKSTGAVVRSFPDVYSRQYALVKGLFTADGLPLQRIGRSLVCGPIA